MNIQSHYHPAYEKDKEHRQQSKQWKSDMVE